MNQTIIKLFSYIKNNKVIKGSFPVYVLNISQCCTDSKGNQTSTPITISQN